jgi:hypothetical protein
MILAAQPRRVIETVDRRVLGAFQLVDAVTRLPVTGAVRVEAQSVVLAGIPGETRLASGSVRILQNRSGVHVIFRAPFFDVYTAAFNDPSTPPEAPVGLRLAIVDAGAHHLPQLFQVDLPRPLDPAAAGHVFERQEVGLFRAPGAPLQDGWAVLRVLVTLAGTNPPDPLPGVLVRVFRSPRGAADQPIGAGMTDWRGEVRGEALVPVTNIRRFRPGSGTNVIEREQAVEFEATRDSRFTGAADQLPDVARILAGAGEGVIRPPDRPPGSVLAVVRPATAVRVEAGRETVVHLAMP